MQAQAIIFDKPKAIRLGEVGLNDPTADSVVVASRFSGISTGTERLLWTGEIPPFPGMGYPLVPGYETVGEVVEAGASHKHLIGQTVFVPGSSSYKDVRGLFGGSADCLVVDAAKVVPIDAALGASGILMALAATAQHILGSDDKALPELIVGHGILGQLIARLIIARTGTSPNVWEVNEERRIGAVDYPVIAPEDDTAHYNIIADASGDAEIIDQLLRHLQPNGEIVLGGFYSERVSFAFPMAFMRQMRLRVAAEWQAEDLNQVQALLDAGTLSFDGLISHQCAVSENSIDKIYAQAFTDPACKKMVMSWEN